MLFPASPRTAQAARRWPQHRAWLLLAGLVLSSPAHSQLTHFATDCLRATIDGLILETSPACVAALRHDPAARTQFVQIIQVTLMQAEAAGRSVRVADTPARSVRRLFDKASQERGRLVGAGGSYYGAR